MPAAKTAVKRKKVDVSGVLKTSGYRPIDKQYFRQARDLPIFTHATVRAMLMDPGVRLNLRMREAPLAGAQIGYKQGDKFVEGVQCEDEAIGKWIYRQLQHIWKVYLPQITKAQIWGWSAGEITLRCGDSGLIDIDRLEGRHAGDCRLLLNGKQKWGVRFNRIEETGHVSLPFPYCWFHSYDADEGEVYGTPNLLGAYGPWADKWFNGGGLDNRRLFMHKDAYGGRKLYYPEGTTFIDGVDTPNEQIARRIVEQLATGGVATLPSTRDENGNLLWEIVEPNTTGNCDHILQYPKDLDDEIRHGQEIPDDVINSGDAGGWAGKRIPMAAFYGSLDHEVVSIFCDLKEQVLDPLIMMNWGRKVSYTLEHKPLAEQAMEQQANAGPGADANPFVPGVQRPDAYQNPYQMSLTAVDPVEAVGAGVLALGDVVGAARAKLNPPVQMSLTEHAYSSTQFNMPADIAERMRDMALRIPDAALAEDGRELQPHITIKYGLITNDVEEVRRVVESFPPVTVMIGRASIFPANEKQSQRGGEQFDVVKLDIESDELQNLNTLLSGSLENFDSHPVYHPHATIAYLKPGLGQYFADQLTGELYGKFVTFDQLVFSDKKRNQIVVHLCCNQ